MKQEHDMYVGHPTSSIDIMLLHSQHLRFLLVLHSRTCACSYLCPCIHHFHHLWLKFLDIFLDIDGETRVVHHSGDTTSGIPMKDDMA